MPRASFTLPDNITKVITNNTKKQYLNRLNKLAQENITTVSDIVQHQDKVIEIAKKSTGSDPDKMRFFLSAIFYATNELPLESKLKLYNEFQNNKPEKYRKFVKGESLIKDDD